MDPISFVVTMLAIYGIMQRTPGLVGEAVDEWQHSRRGEESQAAANLRSRLEEAGVAPVAKGGPLRRFLGNVWRDYWTDRTRARRRNRGDVADEEARSWWQRRQDQLDDEMARRVDGWRADRQQDQASSDALDDGGPRPSAPQPGTAPGGTNDGQPNSGPSGGPGVTEMPDPNIGDPLGFESVIHDEPPNPGPQPNPEPEPEPDRPPIRVAATVGDPLDRPTRASAPTEPAAITAGGTMTIVAQQEVTGVVSGANEARAIQRQIESATAEYVNQLAKVRARIHALGEQTLGTVQMATHSQVVANTAAAAEAAAAAQAAARSCSAEVSPLMGSVARAFDRINS